MSDANLNTVLSAVATLFWFVALSCIPLVLLRRKESASTIAWILCLVFLPPVGFILFWFLGRDRVRRPARKKASANIAVRKRLAGLAEPADEAALEVWLSKQPAEQRGVMRLASRLSRRGITSGNAVSVLVDAPETYAAQLLAIENAKDHVHLESYIVRPDEQGRRFRDALVAAVKRGVRVRFLYDAFGSRSLGAGFLTPLLKAGGYAAAFFPLDPIRRAWTVNLRNHRKIMIVDGEFGFVGGINIGDEFLPWHDIHLQIHGPAVSELQAVFAEDWYFATRTDLVHPAFFPHVPPKGETLMQIVESGPDGATEPVHRLYFSAIAAARDRVYLTTPYFVPDRALLVALQTAALRGVDVRLILPRSSNHRVTFHAGRSYYDELLYAGVQIHEYIPGMLHTKAMVVDGGFGTVGTANLDVRSFRLNFEVIAVVYDPAVVGRLERIFSDDLGRTELVDLEAWRKRGLGLRIMEGAGRLCAPLL